MLAVQHAVVPEEPQIPGAAHRRFEQRRSRVRLLHIVERQQIVDLLPVEASQIEIEICFLKFLQFQCEQFFIPVGPRHGPIHHQPKRAHPRLAPIVAKDDRDLNEAKFVRSF